LRETESPIEAKSLLLGYSQHTIHKPLHPSPAFDHLSTRSQGTPSSLPMLDLLWPSERAKGTPSSLPMLDLLCASERASRRNSELAPNARLALGERASERAKGTPSSLPMLELLWASERAKGTPSSLPTLDLLWASEQANGTLNSLPMLNLRWASEQEEWERGSNDDSAADARVRPSQCLGNDDVLRTESAIYLTLSSESCNLWKPGIQPPYYM
jgi:hypothetical protein